MRDGEDFLEIARLLNGPPPRVPPEASHRSSYGRSYYAVFSVALRALADVGFDFGKGADKHARVPMLLLSSKLVAIRSSGSKLNQMRGLRNQCDYELHRPFPASEATKALLLADGIIRTIRQTQVLDPRLGIPR